MPAGAPTKYNKAILAKANAYLKDWKEQGDMIPSIEALAPYLGVSRATLYNWEDAHAEFLDILDEVMAIQKRTLMNKGLSGDFNSNITKLALGKHGLSDKRELSGVDGKDLIPSGIDTTYE